MAKKTQKTHKWIAKRLKVTKNKKVISSKIGNNHLMTNKGKNHKKFPYGKRVAKAFAKKMRSLISK